MATTNKFNQNACKKPRRPMNDLKFLFLIVQFVWCSCFVFAVLCYFLWASFFAFVVALMWSSITARSILYLPKSHDLCEHWQSSHFRSLFNYSLGKIHFQHTGKLAKSLLLLLSCVERVYGLSTHSVPISCVLLWKNSVCTQQANRFNARPRTITQRENQKEDNHSNCKCE